MEVNYKQGSEEWKQWRMDKIGGSDAAVCLDLNPYKNKLQLYQEKLGEREVFITPAMQRGTDLEPEARKAYMQITGRAMTPRVFQHDQYPFMIASLDGIDLDNTVGLEIKCPSLKNHQMVLQGIIPVYYEIQMLHNMIVADLKQMDFFSYHPDEEPALIRYHLDEEMVQTLMEAEREFHECLINRNPPTLEDDVNEGDAEYLLELHQALREKKKWEKRALELKNKAPEKFPNGIRAKGVQLKRVVSPGRINYKIIPELELVDLEQYKSPDTETWRVTTYSL